MDGLSMIDDELNENVGNVEYQDIPEIRGNSDLKRVGIILILDHSSSMGISGKIDEVNEGVECLVEELRKTEKNNNVGVDLAVVSMGGRDADLIQRMEDVKLCKKIILKADGVTPMKNAINLAVQEIASREAFYIAEGVDYFKPWIIIISDGEPTNMQGVPIKDDSVIDDMKNTLRKTGCLTYTFFVGSGNSTDTVKRAKSVLSKLSTEMPIEGNKKRMAYTLADEKGKLKELFLFISKSIDIKSQNIEDSGPITDVNSGYEPNTANLFDY